MRLKDLVSDVFDGREVFFRYTKTVGDLMSQPVHTVSLEESVSDALARMADARVRHLVVIDTDGSTSGQVVGLVSHRDLLRQSLADVPRSQGRGGAQAWWRVPVGSIVSRHPETATPDEPICELIDVMLTKKIDCLPVMGEEHDVIGIVTATDLFKTLFRVASLSNLAQPQRRRKVRLVDFEAGSRSGVTTARLIDTHFRCIEDVMSDDVLTLGPRDTVGSALKLIQQHHVRHIPVVDTERRLLGIVSDRDIVTCLQPRALEIVTRDATKTFREKLFAVTDRDAGI